MDVMEAIKTRRSVREYSSQPIPADILQRMRQALRYAPSACNIQPWHFILITDPGLRKEVARASREQMWMADAPVTVVACVYPEVAYKYMGGYGNSADIDVTIALDHLTL
ncbi:MAG: nitroreductase family protein, partial [Planctomycetota bacterium]